MPMLRAAAAAAAAADNVIIQRRSVAKSVGCFQRRLFVCQHDNFQTCKHRMMKLGM